MQEKGPWGAPHAGAEEFGIQKFESNEWCDKFATRPDGTSVRYFALSALSVPFIAQFGAGWYRLRWLKAAGRQRSLGTCTKFELTAAALPKTEPAPAAVSAPSVALVPAASSGMIETDRVFDLVERERMREQERWERIEQARISARRETLDEVKGLFGMMPLAAQHVPAPSTEAPPWARELIERVGALEASLEDDDDDDTEEPDDEENLLSEIEASPVAKYIVKKMQKHGSGFLEFLAKAAEENMRAENAAKANGAAPAQSTVPNAAHVDTGNRAP